MQRSTDRRGSAGRGSYPRSRCRLVKRADYIERLPAILGNHPREGQVRISSSIAALISGPAAPKPISHSAAVALATRSSFVCKVAITKLEDDLFPIYER